MKTTTKKIMAVAGIATGVGTILYASKNFKQHYEKMYERHIVKRFVTQNIKRDELLNLISNLNDKQIHFLYQMITSLNRMKEGIRVEGENLQAARDRVIQQVENYLNDIF